MYCTADDVKDKTITRLVTQAGWVDADVNSRILEGQAMLNAKLARMGYTVPFADNAVPDLVMRLSVLYARGAILRDLISIFGRGANSPSPSPYFDSVDKRLADLMDGAIVLIDAAGTIIGGSADESTNRVLSNTKDVPRSLTMLGAEDDNLDADSYAGPGVS